MADISKPEKPVTEQESSVGTQSTPGNDEDKQETRGVGVTEMTRGPDDNRETANNSKDPYEHLRTIFMGLTFFVAACTLVATVFSSYTAKRSVDANVAATRAWIDIAAVAKPRMENSQFVGDLILRNAGPTPATRVIVAYEVVISSIPFPEGPRFGVCPPPKLGNFGVIGANMPFGYGVKGEQWTKEQVMMISDRTARAFIHTCIKYRDVVDPKKERLTEVVHFWPPQSGEGVGIYPPDFRME